MSNEMIRPDASPPPLFSADSGQSLSGREVIDTLFRQKWKILLLWTAVLAATAAYVVTTPAVYDAEMTILVKDKRVELPTSQDAGEKADPGASDTQMATEIQLLSSRELFRMVAIKSGLTQSNSPADIDRAVGRLKKEVRIGPVLKSSLIQVKYSDTDAKRCAQVLQLLSDLYMDMHLQLHSSTGSMEFFSRQAEGAERRLRDAHDRLLDFQAKTKIVLLGEQKDLTLRKQLELESALREAQSMKAETEYREQKLREQMNTMAGRITTGKRTLPNQYLMERQNTMITELQNKRTELLTKFRPDDRMVKQVDQQIADTKRALELSSTMSSIEEQTDVNPVRQLAEQELAKAEVALTGLNARIQSVTRQIAELRGDLSKMETAAPDDQLLLREVAVAEQNLLFYSKKREEARIAQEMDKQKIANVAVVDPPRAPTSPRSKLGSGVPAAAMLALLLGTVFLFAVGHRRTVVQTPWELEAATGIPVLATIPLNGHPLSRTNGARPPMIELEGQVQR